MRQEKRRQRNVQDRGEPSKKNQEKDRRQLRTPHSRTKQPLNREKSVEKLKKRQQPQDQR